MSIKILTYVLILAEIESKHFDNIDLEKLKSKFIGLKSSLKQAIQKSVVKT